MEDLRGHGSTIVLTTHYLEEAQQYADRIGLMHRGTFRREGTVPELTRRLPAAIRFSLSSAASVPPIGTRAPDGRTYVIETFQLQADLKQLLDWAAVLISTLMPLAVSAFFIYRRDTFTSIGSAGYIAAALVFTIGAFSLYTTAVTTWPPAGRLCSSSGCGPPRPATPRSCPASPCRSR